MNDYNLLVTQEAYEESDDPETGLGIAILDFGDMVSILHCTCQTVVTGVLYT